MTEDTLPPLREVIADLGLSAKKSLGQNFILDLNITRKMARQIPGLSNSHILEIGPGPGGLTRGLLMEGARKVTALEKDGRADLALKDIQRQYPDRFSYQIGDATKIDFAALFKKNEPVQIAANLPYNIASFLIAHWLEAEPWPPYYGSITVMVQREVAERFVAKPGTKAYGRLSVLGQWRTFPRILFHLHPSAFTPAPKVASSVIQFIPDDSGFDGLTGPDIGAFTHLLFSKRRKTLRNVLRPLGEDIGPTLEKLGIDPSLRAENLSVLEIAGLAKKFKGLY